MSGALRVFSQHPGVEVVPGYSARAITSGGTLADADFQRIAREFLEVVRSVNNKVDAIYFSLHGALAAESEHDVGGLPARRNPQDCRRANAGGHLPGSARHPH